MPGADEHANEIPRLEFEPQNPARAPQQERPAPDASPRRRVGVVLTLLALGGVLVSVSSALNPASAANRSRRGGASVPGNGERLPYGAAVRGTCVTVDHALSNDMRGWGVYTFDPGRAAITEGAWRELLPSTLAGSASPPGLDSFASMSTRPSDLAQWQLAGGGRQMPVSPADSCTRSIAAVTPDAMASGGSVVLRRPGPYVYWTFDHSVHWARVQGSGPDPTPRPCAQNPNQAARSPAPVGSPPSAGGHDWHWAVDSFCTTVKWWSFSVLGSAGMCPLAADASLWPQLMYINQYAAGSRLGLPLARGKAGGNACGPSSLLMAMLQSERSTGADPRARGAGIASLPDLQKAFDQTMRLPREAWTKGANDFVGSKAETFLRQHGWAAASLSRLGSDAASISNESTGSDLDSSNEATIDRALKQGPIIISTDLGTAGWGITGEGHVIMVVGRAPSNPGEYVVYDPAGNYFSDPVAHYGPKSCGSAVLYPRSWLLASTAGGWYIQLGSPPAQR